MPSKAWGRSCRVGNEHTDTYKLGSFPLIPFNWCLSCSTGTVGGRILAQG